MKYAFIREHRHRYTLSRLCAVLGVSRSGYHDWLDRPESQRCRENGQLTEKIRAHHRRSRKIYGSPKIHRDLVDEGDTCSVNRVARLMKTADIQSRMARKFVITTDSKNTLNKRGQYP